MQQVGRKVQIHNSKLVKKDGQRAQISSVGHKLLYEIHPWFHGLAHILRKENDFLLITLYFKVCPTPIFMGTVYTTNKGNLILPGKYYVQVILQQASVFLINVNCMLLILKWPD
jgi:hypothetical protein